MARNPNTDPRIPTGTTFGLGGLTDGAVELVSPMSDQEIRAYALYCAMSLYGTDAFWPTVVKFEAYIKGE